MDNDSEKIQAIDCPCGWVAMIGPEDYVPNVWALLDDHMALAHYRESNGEAGASSSR
jgi:hypothetical protein